MKRLLVSCFLTLALFVVSCSKPPEDANVRATRLGKQLRCPVCRGVPIADSPAELAQQMMTIVREQVKEGKSDEEIKKYFVERYGEWALLEPRASGMNLIIWVLPIAVLAMGAAIILIYSKRMKAGEKS